MATPLWKHPRLITDTLSRLGEPRQRSGLQEFPVVTLSLSLLVTIVFCAGVAWYSWTAFSNLQRATFDLVELETLRGKISHKNETLELSARMAAATGDQAWVRRYQQILPQLNQALMDARQHAESEGVALAVDATKNAARLRQELDSKAFELLEQGKRAEAYNLLSSEQYREAQRLHQDVETGLLSAIRRDLDGRNARTTGQLSFALLAGITAPVLLVLMWWLANRRVHQWRLRVMHHARRREAAETQLQALNSELGKRVEARARQLRDSEHRLSTLVQSAPVRLFALDSQARFTLSEGAGHAGSDFDPERVIGKNLLDIFSGHGDFCQAVRRSLDGEDCHGTYALDNGIFEVRLTAVLDDDGALKSIIGVATDVSSKHEAEQRAQLLARAVEQNPVGVAIMNTDGIITYANERVVELLGKPSDRLIGRDWQALRTREASSRQTIKLKEIITREKGWANEFRMHRGDDKPVWLRARLTAISDSDNQLSYFLYSVEDISDSKQYQQSLEHQRHYDGLTGLPNRTLADKRINGLLESQLHDRPELTAVMLLDLDDFKKINELSDHHVGDQLLTETAQRISDCVRASETVARSGGDEFLIVLHRFQGLEYVEQIADKVLSALQERFEIGGREFFLSASIGVALAPSDGEDAKELVRKAETAMYQAKSAGRNTYRYFHPEMNTGAQRRMLIDAELHHAIERDELSVHYQPIVDLNDGSVVAAEALLRWKTPVLGPVGPDEFIPVAEASPLIHVIGAWVLARACEQAVAWRDLANRDTPIRIAVNVSSRQFGESDFADKTLRTMRRSGTLPQELSLEVTESLLIDNPPVVAENLSRLAAYGIDISVDDFGTGYSSLGYLKHFSFSTLKIDRLFVRDVIEDRNDAELAAGIIALGHGLHMKVTGEGVETPAQLRFLKSNGCDQAQGFLFGKPMPPEEFERWATEQDLKMNDFLTGGLNGPVQQG